jgi:hypothetical protein
MKTIKTTFILLSIMLLTSCGGGDSEPEVDDFCEGRDNCWELMSREFFDDEVCGLSGGSQIICTSYEYTVQNTCTDEVRKHITRYYLTDGPTLGDIYCDDIYEDEFINID